MTEQMTKVLFTRIPKTLSRMLDAAVKQQRKENPHNPPSKSDVVRQILYKGLTKPKKKKKQ